MVEKVGSGVVRRTGREKEGFGDFWTLGMILCLKESWEVVIEVLRMMAQKRAIDSSSWYILRSN